MACLPAGAARGRGDAESHHCARGQPPQGSERPSIACLWKRVEIPRQPCFIPPPKQGGRIMASNPIDNTPGNIVTRAKNIITQPKLEWPVIDAEPSTIAGIYRSYVVILAAIPALCTAIGLFLMGSGFFHFSASYIIGQAILSYVLTLVGVYLFALILEALAPSFGGTKDRVKAFKLAAYSWTVAWVAGVTLIIPLLGVLVLIAALYGFY